MKKYVITGFLIIIISAGIFNVVIAGISLRTIYSLNGEPMPNYFYTFTKNSTRIVWVTDPMLVSEELAKRTEDAGYTVGGTSYTRNGVGTCTIYAYEPKGQKDYTYLRVLGHEVLHCFRGAFHELPIIKI